MIVTIRNISPKGYCFVRTPDHLDVFCHVSAFEDRTQFDGLFAGQQLDVEIGQRSRGPEVTRAAIVPAPSYTPA